jgi:hypothetical protein
MRNMRATALLRWRGAGAGRARAAGVDAFGLLIQFVN